jgi:hypothetical protein
MKALGIQYEKRAAAAIVSRWSNAVPGQWVEYVDDGGHGYAQFDVLVVAPEVVLVFECKLSETGQGRRQIEDLYKPLLEHIFERPIRGIVVARHLTRETRPEAVVGTLGSAFALAAGGVPTLHWLGRGALA